MSSIPMPKEALLDECDAARDWAAVHEALIAGQRAGSMLLSASLNPYPPDSEDYNDWARGWRSATARRLAADLRERARKLCDPCTCNGKGLCLKDAA